MQIQPGPVTVKTRKRTTCAKSKLFQYEKSHSLTLASYSIHSFALFTLQRALGLHLYLTSCEHSKLAFWLPSFKVKSSPILELDVGKTRVKTSEFHWQRFKSCSNQMVWIATYFSSLQVVVLNRGITFVRAEQEVLQQAIGTNKFSIKSFFFP